MPQIIKGGKYIFGWSKVGNQGKIKIPPEAFREYNLSLDECVILFSGSKTSGGFGVSSIRILRNSAMNEITEKITSLAKYKIPEGEIIEFKNRKYCLLRILDDKSIVLPERILDAFEINTNDLLLSGRGSHLAIGFIAKGPIFEEAKKHPEIEMFE
ncbi:MAG: hypothetical protein ACFFDH_20955 [Promethearchaeota archaeon]